jgi:hypothetical protein
MNRPSPIPTAPSRRGFLAVLSAGAASAVAPAALAAPLAPVTETVPSSLLPAAAAASEVDPIFAVIAEHRAAQEAVTAAFDREDREAGEDEVIWAAQDRQMDAQFELFTIAPTTLAGVASLLAYLGTDAGDNPNETVWEYAHGFGDEELVAAVRSSPTRLAAAVRAMAGTVTIRRIEPSEPDPIYAAIKAEREAYAAYLATAEAESRINDQCPDPIVFPIVFKPGAVPRKRRKTAAVKAWWAEYQKAEVVHEKACQEFWAARETFLHTQPTTVVGLRAFIDHIDGPFSHGDGCEAFWDEHEMEMACPTLTAAVRSLIG